MVGGKKVESAQHRSQASAWGLGTLHLTFTVSMPAGRKVLCFCVDTLFQSFPEDSSEPTSSF